MTRVSRRVFIRGGLGSALGIWTGVAQVALAACGGRKDAPVDWPAFIAGVHKLAAKHASPPRSSRPLVEEIAALSSRVEPDAVRAVPVQRRSHDADIPWPAFNWIHHEPRFEIVLLEFDPGDAIPAHNHPGLHGVLTCGAGEIEVESFQLERDVPGAIVLKRVSRDVLVPGQTSALTPDWRNIHRVRAPDGGQVIDLFLPPYDDPSVGTSRWFSISNQPEPDRPDLFRAQEQRPA